MNVLSPGFRLSHFRFTLAPREPIRLPRTSKGITLRGAFGTGFRTLVCADRAKECPQCLLHPACPSAIKPPLDGFEVYDSGQTFSFGLVLVGRVQDFLPYFLVSFRELGERGI